MSDMREWHCAARGHKTVAEKEPARCWCGSTKFWSIEAPWPAYFKEVWDDSYKLALRLTANEEEIS